MRVGFHTNLAMYLASPLPKADIIQIFLGRPVGFYPTEPKNIDAIKLKIKELDLKICVHAPYVYSLKHKKESLEGINQLQTIMKKIGIEHMVVHCRGGENINEWINFINSTANPEMILLENMAHGEFITLSEMEKIAEQTGCGICIDTSHLWNSGDTTTLRDWNHVKLIHCNVVDGIFGGKKDNHTNRSISVGNLEWLAERVLNNTSCDIITEISPVVGHENEISIIKSLLK